MYMKGKQRQGEGTIVKCCSTVSARSLKDSRHLPRRCRVPESSPDCTIAADILPDLEGKSVEMT